MGIILRRMYIVSGKAEDVTIGATDLVVGQPD